MEESEIKLYKEILETDSTTGRERALADMLLRHFRDEGIEAGYAPEPGGPDRPANILARWGRPDVVFCTHLDTVPPYIPSVIDGDTARGRGACDAKGQIISMYIACRRLAAAGARDFGLLLLHGEETGSFGAKEFRNLPGGQLVVVGEPTGNLMVSASKGTKAFAVTISGKSFHSGYPQHGDSAIDRFVELAEAIRRHEFPRDPELGETTYNIGMLRSDNPQNIISDHVTCRIYFRTTFASDAAVGEFMMSLASDHVRIEALGGDTPMRYTTLPGFATTTVSFGSDAPQLTNFRDRMLCGPGSILVAHRPEEYIDMREIDRAADLYVEIYQKYKSNPNNRL